MPGCMFHGCVFIWRCRPQGFCMSKSFVPVLGRTLRCHLACDAGGGSPVALLQQPLQRKTALLGVPNVSRELNCSRAERRGALGCSPRKERGRRRWRGHSCGLQPPRRASSPPRPDPLLRSPALRTSRKQVTPTPTPHPPPRQRIPRTASLASSPKDSTALCRDQASFSITQRFAAMDCRHERAAAAAAGLICWHLVTYIVHLINSDENIERRN